MRVGVLGINHKLANLELREALAKICQKRLQFPPFSNPHFSAHGLQSFVLLSTCNRTEVYFSSDDLAETHSYLLSILRENVEDDFDQKLYSYFGQDCLKHLSRVAAGLDSAIVAETEIQGQVKTAYETTHEYQTLPFDIHYLFQKSLAISKRIRNILPQKPGLPDIEHAIYQTGSALITEKQNPSILFVGTSLINEKVLGYFKEKKLKNIAITNRSEDKGRLFALKYQTHFIPWSNLVNWPHFDWVIVATKASHFLITKKFF